MMNVQHESPEHFVQLEEAVIELYQTVFSEPPYFETEVHVRQFRSFFEKHLQAPGFSFMSARDDARLVGMAYGVTFAPGRWWADASQEPPEELRTAPTFAVMEWAVHPDYRRQGIGSQLINALLADRAESWATLCVNPHAHAYDIYLRAGWQPCGTSGSEPLPPAVILIKELKP
ncbi:MAG: GNAT family N-acetyltransferase [Corynebacteriales bacterium]|nr:GNAT family N-acetyltransferase [Mycobacteriales bacterium]